MAQPVRLETIDHDSAMDDTADAVKVILVAGSGVLKTISVTKALIAASGYTANDVLSEHASQGTSWVFSAIARIDGAAGYITKAVVISQSESVTPRLTAYVFKAAPTSNLNDNVANTGPDAADKANYLGPINFDALESLGTTDSTATATPNTASGLPLAFDCASGVDDLFLLVVTRDDFTQTTGENLTIHLTVEQY